MDLETLWFILIALLFTGYFFLEGFDFGVGILYRFLPGDRTERSMMRSAIGPHWDANEVWLITAGGAMFAAFPDWYATLFSGFYLPLFLIVVALIVRIVGIELRGKMFSERSRSWCDALFFLGSLLPAFLWGVAITNIVRGVPIDASMTYTGTLLTLLSPYALLGGVVSTLVFTLHGALFLSMRVEGELAERARRTARSLWWPAALALGTFALLGYRETVLFERMGLVPGTLPLMAVLSFVACYVFIHARKAVWAFASGGATIVLGTVVAFEGLFPRVMVSSLGPQYDLTIRNASSSEYTLQVMLLVALTLLPLVLGYQAWTYWIFRQRVTRRSVELEGSH
ncbi:cytochrome d ubiquinol oxidase subunit II [Deinobacterium chartae]|uniref:Cytochrome d ubiquinol oxidase subunit II n=1 Tax=Deinobacterium chartae TaxID=521158 RepID=A0A841I034_9DEIO|nr:cytochrome d ubiquinol oxidase subunit II [Deinobacterium chartae]MBB6098476.1 cytochrome d ubiquinol oxidase subunit II [Deinobacterium chartae]